MSESIQSVEPKQNRSFIRWIVLVVILGALAWGGSAYYSYSSVRESTDDAQVDGHIFPVSAMREGRLTEVNVENNQVVQAGAILAKIDPAWYQAAIEKAKGEIAEAIATEKERRTAIPIVSLGMSSETSGANAAIVAQNARIATAKQEIAAANERLAAAEARVREAQANATKAESDLNRMKPLVAKEEISRRQFDEVTAAAAAATASVDAAQGQVREIREAVRVAQARFEQEQAQLPEIQARLDGTKSAADQIAARKALAESAAAQIESKQAVLKQSEIDLDYTVIRAPVSGVISQRSMEIGQMVSRGQALVAITPLEGTWITANFKESQLAHLKQGQRVEIEVDAYPDRAFEGHVESISAATGARFSLMPPENATGNFVKVVQRVPVRILVDKGPDADHPLRPGTSVTPTVLIK